MNKISRKLAALLMCSAMALYGAASVAAESVDGPAGEVQPFLQTVTADIDSVQLTYNGELQPVRSLSFNNEVYVSLDDLCVPLRCRVIASKGAPAPDRFSGLTVAANIVLYPHSQAFASVSASIDEVAAAADLAASDQQSIEIDPNPGIVTFEGIRAFLHPIAYGNVLFAPAANVAGSLDKRIEYDSTARTLDLSDYRDIALGTVNGDLIRQRDIDYFMAAQYEAIANDAANQGISKEEIAKRHSGDIFDQIVDDLVIYQKAIDDNTYLDPLDYSVINSNLSRVVDGYGGIAGYAKHLQELGVSFGQVLKMYRMQYTNYVFANRLVQQIQASDEEIGQYYAQHGKDYMAPEKLRVNHILLSFHDENGVPVPDDKKAELKAKADDLLKQIRAGADYYALMKKNSDDKYFEQQPRGFVFSRGEVDPAFADAAFSLQVGGVSDVVETKFGYHIIRLEEKIPARPKTLDEARDSILPDLTAAKQQQTFNDFLQQWKASKYIVKF
ncbi:MAG: putative peptidyl-prolyl cis-trans isomerase, PpiC-type [Paenibacillaceae bacterium]|jgi:parvulin-like peptidyl-prolyl isomerase|nr:putative peptidyl-prolyl cis-trans isomerase, PpiC-type [Paenibacillaceae bacterium]